MNRRPWLGTYFGPWILRVLGVDQPERTTIELAAGAGVALDVEDIPDGDTTKVTISAPGGGAGPTISHLSTGASNDVPTRDMGGTFASAVAFTGGGNKTATGFADGAISRQLTLLNKGSGTLTVAHESADSSASNRVVTPTGADVVIDEGGGATLFYDDGNSRWTLLGMWSGGGATPGGSDGDLQRNAEGALAPVRTAANAVPAAGAISRWDGSKTIWDNEGVVEVPDDIAVGDLLVCTSISPAVMLGKIDGDGVPDNYVLTRNPEGTGLPAWSAPTGGGGGGGFDLASLDWEGLWLAPYGGSPWAGTTSAGASGSRALTEGSDPPAVGAALNGKAGALFESGDVLPTGLSLGTFVAATSYSFAFVAQADSVPSDPGAGSRNTVAGLFGDSGSTYLCCAVHAGGVTLSHYDGGYKEVTVAFSTGAPHIVQGYYDGTNINIAVDGVWGTPLAAGSLGGTTGNVRVGAGGTNVRFPGTIWAAGFSKLAFDAPARANILAGLEAEFDL